MTTIPALLASAMVIWSVLELAVSQLPRQVLTFNSDQFKATLGIGAAGVMLALPVSDTGSRRGLGFWFLLIGSLAMATGAVMALLGKWSDVVDLPAQQSDPSVPPPPPPGG